MLSIGAADQALSRQALEAPGGFLWWYADLVAVTGNPMDDIRLLERIDKVMCGGRWTTTEARPHEST